MRQHFVSLRWARFFILEVPREAKLVDLLQALSGGITWHGRGRHNGQSEEAASALALLSYFVYSGCSGLCGFPDWGETALPSHPSPQGWPILGESKELGAHISYTNKRSGVQTLTNLLHRAPTLQEVTFLCPHHPGPTTRQLETTARVHSPGVACPLVSGNVSVVVPSPPPLHQWLAFRGFSYQWSTIDRKQMILLLTSCQKVGSNPMPCPMPASVTAHHLMTWASCHLPSA